MDKLIDKMTTDYYRVLKVLVDSLTTIDNNTFSPITQLEIAEKLNISTMTVSTIIRHLKEDKLIYPYNSGRGRYCISEEATKLIKNIEKYR